MSKNLNIWFFLSLIISLFVLIPILTVFSSFFEDTSNYYEILKETFLIEYIFNSTILLFCSFNFNICTWNCFGISSFIL